MKFELNFKRQVALITEVKEYTYEELKEESEKISSVINERCLIFLFCTNSFESIAGYIGFINKKIVPMMIDYELDFELSLKLIEIYKPKYMWLPKILSEKYSYEKIFECGNYELLSTNEEQFELNEELAILMTTSGSTGSPKFVRQSYENLESNTQSIIEYLQLNQNERSITNLPMNYVYGLSILNTHLKIGASIVVTDKTLFQKEFWTMIKEKEVTNINGVPYTYTMLERLRFFRMKLPSLKFMTQAGGKLDPELHKRFAEYSETVDKKFYVMYGAAEATARMGYLPAEESLNKVGYMGIAIPNGKFELIDENENVITESNAVGELIYYGKNVSLGYAQCGEDLKLGNINNYRLATGDLAIRDDEGFYKVVGRKKRFLKMFGKRTNLQEVEHLLYEKFHIEVACAGVDDKMYIFVTEEESDIVKYLSEKLNLHSSAFNVKVIEEIPKNSSGKIIYKELEKYYDE